MAKMSLGERIRRLDDVSQIENMMGRYERMHTAGLHAENVERHWARTTPGVKTHISHVGIWEGAEGIRRFWVNCQNPVWDRLGHMHLHTCTTPVIEIAEDGRTAQGVWLSPGVESAPVGKPMWGWVRYGVDFVREGDAWKFWHFRLYRLFMTPYDHSWTEKSLATGGARAWPEDKAPDRVPQDDWVYSPAAVTRNDPAPPRPYATWTDAQAYVQ